MNNWIKSTGVLLIAAFISEATFAQTSSGKDSKVSKEQDIIIRIKGDKAGKTTIVIDGDNVTINGKPMDEYKNDDLTILRRTNPTIVTAPRIRAITPRGGLQMFENGGEIYGTNRALLGVVTEKAENGAKVTSVSKESAAEKAGLKKDDVITKVGDKKIEEPSDLSAIVGKHKPNDKVDVTYRRGNKENKTSVTLGENKSRNFAFNFDRDDFNLSVPPPPNAPDAPGSFFSMSRRPRIGMQIQDVEEGKGVTVKDIDTDSPAAKAGFKEGDVITEVNGKEIAGVDDLRNEIRDLKEGDSVKVRYRRGGSTQNTEIKLPKRMKTADL